MASLPSFVFFSTSTFLNNWKNMLGIFILFFKIVDNENKGQNQETRIWRFYFVSVSYLTIVFFSLSNFTFPLHFPILPFLSNFSLSLSTFSPFKFHILALFSLRFLSPPFNFTLSTFPTNFLLYILTPLSNSTLSPHLVTIFSLSTSFILLPQLHSQSTSSPLSHSIVWLFYLLYQLSHSTFYLYFLFLLLNLLCHYISFSTFTP